MLWFDSCVAVLPFICVRLEENEVLEVVEAMKILEENEVLEVVEVMKVLESVEVAL